MKILEWVIELIKPPKQTSVPDEKKKEKTSQWSDESPRTSEIYNVSSCGHCVSYSTSGYYADDMLTGKKKHEDKLKIDSYIIQYRDVSDYPEADEAINEITNEAIVSNTEKEIVKIDLDKVELPDNIKKKIEIEFDNLLTITNFNNIGIEKFDNWYIDGRMIHEVVIDPNNLSKGILKVIRLDPLRLELVKEEDKETGRTYYMWKYTPPNSSKKFGFSRKSKSKFVHPEYVIYTGSGLYERCTGIEISYLHKAVKPINNLRNLEDSLIIYRLVRAPERRIFKIYTGQMPKSKSEAYVTRLMNKFKNRAVYNQSTGAISTDKRVIAMTEDFWFPKDANDKGTEVDTLPGGGQLGEMEDVYYFLRKMYRALNIPESRANIEEKSQLSVSPQTEIERDEVRFFKFISKLRRKFSLFFIDLLRRQLVYKKTMTPEEFKKIEKDIRFYWESDNYYQETKENEILRMRIDMVNELEPQIGKYYTEDWVALNILKFSEQEWEKRKKEIELRNEQEEKENEKEEEMEPIEDEKQDEEDTKDEE